MIKIVPLATIILPAHKIGWPASQVSYQPSNKLSTTTILASLKHFQVFVPQENITRVLWIFEMSKSTFKLFVKCKLSLELLDF